VAAVGVGEKLLNLFYVYPFKCQLCGFRFRCLQRGLRSIRVAEDRRVYDRLAIHLPVTFSGNGGSAEGTMIEISMAGCSFSTSAFMTIGMNLKMGLKVSSDAAPILVGAAVVRHARPQAIGVEFLQWPPGERQRLQQIIRGLLIDR
jgi:hypothetical protein